MKYRRTGIELYKLAVTVESNDRNSKTIHEITRSITKRGTRSHSFILHPSPFRLHPSAFILPPSSFPHLRPRSWLIFWVNASTVSCLIVSVGTNTSLFAGATDLSPFRYWCISLMAW